MITAKREPTLSRIFFSLLFTIGFVALFLQSLLAEETPKLEESILVLPLQAEGAPAGGAYAGLGLQNVLENMLLVHSGVEQTELFGYVKDLFPAEKDFQAWFNGPQSLPDGIRETPPRYILAGQIRFTPDEPFVRLQLLDRQKGQTITRDIPLDLPALGKLRPAFVELLQAAGVPVPPAQQPKMLWRENLSFEALALLGEGVYKDLVVTLYGGENGIYDQKPFEEGLRLSPDSYLFLNDLGWVLYRQNKYTEAKELFQSALRINPDGVDSADGIVDCWRKIGDTEQEEIWSMKKAEIQGRDPKLVIAELWNRRAVDAYKQGDYNRAIECLRKALDLHVGDVVFPVLLAGAYRKLLRFEEGEQMLQKMLAKYPDPEDHKRLQIAYARLERDWADQLEQKDEFVQALTHLQNALQTDRKISPDQVSADLNQLGNIYRHFKRYPQAIALYREALSATGHDSETEELALLGLALAYRGCQEYDKEVEYLERVLVSARNLKQPSVQASTLNGIGNAYIVLKKYELARAKFQESLELHLQLNEPEGKASALQGLGVASYFLDNYDKAVSPLEQALPIHRTLADHDNEAMDLFILGRAYKALRQYRRAVPCLEQWLTVKADWKDREQEGIVLQSLGSCYALVGRFDDGIAYLNRSLAIAREIRSQENEMRGLQDLANAYFSLGYYSSSGYENVIQNLEQALSIARKIPDPASEFDCLIDLVWPNVNLKRTTAAQAYAEQALALARRQKDRKREKRALGGLAAVEIQTSVIELASHHDVSGLYQRATELTEQALAIAREQNEREDEGSLLGYLAAVYTVQKNYPKVLYYAQQSLAIAREFGDKDAERIQLTNLMRATNMLDQKALAIFYGKQAVNILQQMRESIRDLTKELQEGFVHHNESDYRELADLLISVGRLPEAEQVIKLLKQKEYLDFVRQDTREASGLPGELELTPEEAQLVKKYDELAGRVTAVGTEIHRLRSKLGPLAASDQERLTQLQQELQIANAYFEKYLEGLSNELGNTEAGRKVYEISEAQSLSQALREMGEGTVALFTLVADEKYHVLLITPDSREAKEYPIKVADLNKKVLAFRRALENEQVDPRHLAKELYDILVAPIAKDLEEAHAKTLMWSLDGTLRYLPIAALYDGRQYLVERYQTEIFTIGSLVNLKEKPHERWRALGLGVSKAHSPFLSLPAVPAELHAVIRDEAGNSSSEGVLPGRILLDEQFTEKNMEEALKEGYELIHIASHFQFKPGNNTDSFLLLGDGTPLTLAEIMATGDLFAGVDLLALSACNTAMSGVAANGTEVEGFNMRAQQQGAKAVLATLWSVSDESTRLLMERFYKLRAENPQITKTEALRQAQLTLLRGAERGSAEIAKDDAKPETESSGEPIFQKDASAPYAHPYFWAPFILFGNWR